MHGSNPGSVLLLNAEVDSMGGVVDSGVGIGLKTSPCPVAIEKAQAELRQEYDVREERRRELEFLEKGGNPLDFKFGIATSASVQSTSVTDQHHEQFMTSEAKCSFAITASPHGDSVESSGRPEPPAVCEPNIADNLLLFDGETKSLEGEKNTICMGRKNAITPPEQALQKYGSQNAKESEDSAIFRPYARRNRTRSNRDGARGGSRDGKGSLLERNNLREQKMPLASQPNPTNLNGNMVGKNQTSTKHIDWELDGGRLNDASGSGISEETSHVVASKSSNKEEIHLSSHDFFLPDDTALESNLANAVEELEEVPSMNFQDSPCATIVSETESGPGQPNGSNNLKDDSEGNLDQVLVNGALEASKDLDSCIPTCVGSDINNNNNNICVDGKNDVSNGHNLEHQSEFGNQPNLVSCEVSKEIDKKSTADGCTDLDIDQISLCRNDFSSVGLVKVDEGLPLSNSVMQNKLNGPSDVVGMQQNEHTIAKSDKTEGHVLGEISKSFVEYVEPFAGSQKGMLELSKFEVTQTDTVRKDATAGSDSQTGYTKCLKLADKAHEDAILEEARIIQAKRKRIAELSAHRLPSRRDQKSHWDFVIEEMTWLANDFAQERLWKLTAAAQLCYGSAHAFRLRSEEKARSWRMKSLAHNVAKTVMQFWHKIDLLLVGDNIGFESDKVDSNGVSMDKRDSRVLGYAVRFVKYNRSLISSFQAEGPATPDIISDSRTVNLSWEEQLTEETLFYTIPATAMETYRKSIESHLMHEKTGLSVQEEVETSTQYSLPEFASEEVYAEDEGEPSSYYTAGAFENKMTLKSAQRKYRAAVKSNNPWEAGVVLSYGHCVAPPHSISIGKRPPSLNVGTIPTKRMRTATRQRVSSPFGPGVTGNAHTPNKTDASSGDTNSFQDDHSILHGGSQMQKSVEVESVCDFEKQLCYDYSETLIKSKKKTTKHPQGSVYDQGWQIDCAVLNDQRDHSKKRSDNQRFESDGTGGFYPNHVTKKPKMVNKSIDPTYDSVSPVNGSIPSPAASQMSNISNQNRLIKLTTGSGRDKGRKQKPLKMSTGQPGTGTPWSLFEDQALVVLVHDMGPNWELISDAINGTLHFKCVFRKPEECKEHHKTLMERSCGDGADSADDSALSQSYPSTLPGIPKGSARQLFQRLQGPMEEDILKSHFDIIIRLGKKLQFQRNQKASQDAKQIVHVHNSHVVNNLNAGVLTPLDLCDATTSSPEILPHGCQGTLASGLALSNQGSVGSVLPTSGLSSSLQGSSGVVMGNNLASHTAPLAASMRDRYGVPKVSLPTDEQQRLLQYNQMLSGRNVQQSVTSSLSGSDHVRMLPGGNGMGVMCGVHRSMPISRPGFLGVASSSMLNSGGVLPSGMVSIPGPVSVHSGAGPGPVNSVLRPRDALQVIRSCQNPDHQRQMVGPDLQMQVTQGASQSIPAFNGLSSSFNSETTACVQPFPGHGPQQHQVSHQQSHLSSPHHSHLQGSSHATNLPQQAYAMRLAKERQLKQRYLRQQQQFAASNALLPQSQLPASSSLQNGSPIQSQSCPLPASLPSVAPSSPVSSVPSQQQQKHHLPQHGVSRTPTSSGLCNQAVKQQQRQLQQQQLQQPCRQHPNQWQHTQTQPQAKLQKGIVRGNMVGHQNMLVDGSHLNGQSMPSGDPTGVKGDQIMQMMQGKDTYSGPNQASKSLRLPQSSNHSQFQQKMHSSPATSTSKQLQQLVPADNSTVGQVVQVPPVYLSRTSLPAVPSTVASSNQSQSLQKQVNQMQSSQASQSMLDNSHVVTQAFSTQLEQQPTHNANHVNVSSTSHLVAMDTANTRSITTTVSQLEVLELPYNSDDPNAAAKVGSSGSPIGSAVQNSAGNETQLFTNQRLDTIQISGGLQSHGCNSSAQWQEQLPVRQPPAQLSPEQSLQPLEQQQ